MKHDKRRHEAPEDRRDWQDKQNKREARQDDWNWASKLEKEDPVVSVASAMKKVKEDLGAFASMIVSTPSSRGIVGKEFKYMYMDELPDTLPKRVPDYVADTTWAGWKPEPADHRGKHKKKWHSTQYKAYKKWNADAELRAAIEAEIVGESREDLGWGGF